MPTYEVTPLAGVGPVRLGMTREESREAMGALGQVAAPYRKNAESAQETDAYHNSAFQVFFDDTGRVEFVELSRGERTCVAIYRGRRILSLRAAEAVALVERDAAYDRAVWDLGHSYVFPALELALWRPATSGRDGRTFATVGAGRRGYYSTP